MWCKKFFQGQKRKTSLRDEDFTVVKCQKWRENDLSGWLRLPAAVRRENFSRPWAKK